MIRLATFEAPIADRSDAAIIDAVAVVVEVGKITDTVRAVSV